MAFVYSFAQEDPLCPNYHYMISLNTNECTFPYQFLKVEIDKADQIDYAITQLSVLITFPYGTGALVDEDATRRSLNPKLAPGNGWTGLFYFGPGHIALSTNNKHVFGGPPVSMNELADEGIFTIVFKGQHNPPKTYRFRFFDIACYVHHLLPSGTEYGPCYGNGNSGYLLSTPVHPYVTISGTMRYLNREGLGPCKTNRKAFPGLKVIISSLQMGPPGEEVCVLMTDAAGDYSCNQIVPYCTYRVRPEKTDHADCGVDNLDVLRLLRHLNNDILFQHTWQFIAADINKDASITLVDAILLQEFTSGLSPLPKPWRFINKELYDFWDDNMLQPTNFFEFVNRYVDQNGLSNLDMYGIKIGDITTDSYDDVGSCDICDAQIDGDGNTTRSKRAVVVDPRLHIPDLVPNKRAMLYVLPQEKGDEVVLALPEDAVGALISLKVDDLDVVGFESVVEGRGIVEFYRPPGTDVLRFAYLSDPLNTSDAESPIGVVRLRSTNGQPIRLTFESNPRYNYMVDYSHQSIALGLSRQESSVFEGLFPNPAVDYTFLRFNEWLTEGSIEMWLYDVSGKTVMYHNIPITQPVIEHRVELSSLSKPGLYYCRVLVGGETYVKPLFIAR